MLKYRFPGPSSCYKFAVRSRICLFLKKMPKWCWCRNSKISHDWETSSTHQACRSPPGHTLGSEQWAWLQQWFQFCAPSTELPILAVYSSTPSRLTCEWNRTVNAWSWQRQGLTSPSAGQWFGGKRKLQEQSTKVHCWAGATKPPEATQECVF